MLTTRIFGWIQLIISIILLTLAGYNLVLFRSAFRAIVEYLPYESIAIARTIRTSLTIFLVIFGILVLLILLQGILNIRKVQK